MCPETLQSEESDDEPEDWPREALDPQEVGGIVAQFVHYVN
jgi:hypothetical protein